MDINATSSLGGTIKTLSSKHTKENIFCHTQRVCVCVWVGVGAGVGVGVCVGVGVGVCLTVRERERERQKKTYFSCIFVRSGSFDQFEQRNI